MKVLLTANEPIVPEHGRIAGLQVRVYEMARALVSEGCEVGVLGQEDRQRRPWATFVQPREALSFRADIWVCVPLLVDRYRDLIGTVPLLVDCYEPPFGSYLHYARSRPAHAQRLARATFRREMAQYLWALASADGALVANERQKAAIAGLLALCGRLEPLAPVADRVLVVSSGVPPAPDPPPMPATAQEPLVVWAGGAYPWFSIDRLFNALRHIALEVPEVRFRLAGLHGRDEVLGARQAPAALLLAKLEKDPALSRRVELTPWISYADRVRVYDGATLAVSTHDQHLETYFSMRTRLLDALWAGIPLVTNGGDALTEVLGAAGAAVVSDDAHLADNVITLLGSPDRRATIVDRSRSLAEGALSWRVSVAPLLSLRSGFALLPPASDGMTALEKPQLWRRRVRENLERAFHIFRLRVAPRG